MKKKGLSVCLSVSRQTRSLSLVKVSLKCFSVGNFQAAAFISSRGTAAECYNIMEYITPYYGTLQCDSVIRSSLHYIEVN